MVDIIILDGGSTDGSTNLDILRGNNVSALLVKLGPGKLSAQLRMGYSYAIESGYEGFITIDGNNKDKVDDILKFVEMLDAGYDLVQGSRFIKGGKAINNPVVRKLAIKLIHAPLVSLAADFHYTDTTNGFRGYSRKLLLHPSVMPFRKIFFSYELLPYLSVAAPKSLLKKEDPSTWSNIRIATKYPNLTKNFYASKGIQVETIKLNGSMELAPSLSMCRRIVDLVSTGKTLKENGLKEVDKIMNVQSKLILNRSAYKTKTKKIESIINSIQKIIS